MADLFLLSKQMIGLSEREHTNSGSDIFPMTNGYAWRRRTAVEQCRSENTV